MTNIFNQQPDLMFHASKISAKKVANEHQMAIAFNQNIFRPAGGGQPNDLGFITIGDKRVDVLNVFKQDGETWVLVDCPSLGSIEIGNIALLEVDKLRRVNFSRSHSLTHLMMAAARHVLADFDSKGASIADDGLTVAIKLQTSISVTNELISAISCLTQYFIHRNAPILIVSQKSVADAAARFRNWRVDSELGLSGKIRVVNIVNIDANPCSGSHASTTGEIGPFEFINWAQLHDLQLEISARRAPVWTHSCGDEYLRNLTRLDLSVFND